MSNIIQLDSRPPITPVQLIEEAKRVAGVSQRELASRISASKDQLYRWKSGKVEMPDTHRLELEKIIDQKTSPSDKGQCSPDTKVKSSKSLAWERFYLDHKSDVIDLDVIPFLEMAYAFGFKFPGHVDQAGRATQSQVEQVIKEHGASFSVLDNWISMFLVMEDRSEAVTNAMAGLKAKLNRLAMAKMDLTSIFKQTLDKDQFAVQAYASTMEVENDLKDLLKAHLESGGVIQRNLFRLTSSTNESLITECKAFEEKSSDITQYFTLEGRTILRELKSLKNMISR
ncbi:hypothetical protein [Sulfitobacter sp. R18_1]|uniref:hypothetical protein n=1 Tax=Sulfitobacter sp. R18_1 TaxID=2821104 RepID=UPI001ADC123A|nr:hypothetical protein [Sulfitobacter sp. R18_1]MBO9428464.1 hypothetical protein [Sulfitobacter sp. R18_1]